MVTIESLLDIHNGDFELWKEQKYKMEYYHISIEGYIGFKKIEDFISLYEYFLGMLHSYLIKNEHLETAKTNWKPIYKKRAIEVCYEMDCYWVFLDGYESTNIWDTYYYLEDVINQLKEVNIEQ